MLQDIQQTDNDSYKEAPSSKQLPTADLVASILYPGDFVDDEQPEQYKVFTEFHDPFRLVCFFDDDIASGRVTLHPWQMDVNKDLAEGRNLETDVCCKPTQQNVYKYVLLASNGSGKDKFVIAPFSIWFAMTKKRSRTIITTSSGTQLTSQTEPYIKDLAEKVNKFYKAEIFRIRQRYIKCMTTGSEIRMFATDESGKAEGYHPIDADSEMAIIVNEGKSVTEDIHRALRRCTGFNYWLEVSSAGEPKGFLYDAYKRWPNKRRITSYDCPHTNLEELNEDKELDGEHSAFFRSKHLSMFTQVGGSVIVPLELIDACVRANLEPKHENWPRRVGIDLAAGGDENVICITKGNTCLKEEFFRETDTTIAAQRINDFLLKQGFPKNYQHIYADDGGVGKSIIDQLNSNHGWSINRVMNQWAAIGSKKQFGNRGAENWWRVARIIEERQFALHTLTTKTRDQIGERHYKQSLTGGKIYLEDKKEAKADGRKSPDRADAFILSLTGLTVTDFVDGIEEKPADSRPKVKLLTQDAVLEHFENNETYKHYDEQKQTGKRCFNSLRAVLN